MTNPKILEAIEKLDDARHLLESCVQPEETSLVYNQTIRFTAREKAALQRLAKAQRRSEHFIMKDLLAPALFAAEKKLDD